MAKHIIILGAGISGLSAAWRLSDKGVGVDILEAASFVGGLAGTVREDGCCMDFGPHSFFSEDQQTVDAVLALFDNKLQPRLRKVKFYNNGEYFNYPLTAQSVLLQMGFRFGALATLSFAKDKLFVHSKKTRSKINEEDETIEEWAIASFGKYLYRAFFKPYTEQFWKIPCSELSSRSIPSHTRLSFINTLKLLLRYKAAKDKHSLIERETLPIYYPETGFAEIAEHIAKVIEENHGHIHLGCEVCGVAKLPGGKMRVFYQCNGQTKIMDGDYIISTIPLPNLVKMLKNHASPEIINSADKLDYQSLMVLNMLTKKQNVIDCEYAYLLNKPFNRITEMNNFSQQTSPPGKNIIAVEITCSRHSSIWKASKEEIFNMCIDSLSQEGFLKAPDVEKVFLLKTPYAYPIYRKDYHIYLKHQIDYLRRYDSLVILGRCGEFMYMDIDRCIKRAFGLADRLLRSNT